MVCIRNSLIGTVVLAVLLSSSAYAIQRTATRSSFIEFRGGYAMPQGSHRGFPDAPFTGDSGGILEFDAENVYKDGFFLGIGVGQVLAGSWFGSVNFDYARNEVQRPVEQRFGNAIYSRTFERGTAYRQYDLTFRTGYSFLNLAQSSLSPYIGLNGSAGLEVLSTPGFATNNEFDFGLGLDFGLDFKVWSAPNNRSFMTVSSLNSWNFVSTGERVSHLSVGAGIRYFFKR